jgi:hypothetical protein
MLRFSKIQELEKQRLLNNMAECGKEFGEDFIKNSFIGCDVNLAYFDNKGK